jgi:hypothetical protein
MLALKEVDFKFNYLINDKLAENDSYKRRVFK